MTPLIIIPIILLILLCLGIVFRKNISSWIKNNKKKAIAIGGAGLTILGGAGTFMMPAAGILTEKTAWYHGGTYGLSASMDLSADTATPLVFDTDGDGYKDIIIGGDNFDEESTSYGYVYCIDGQNGDILWTFDATGPWNVMGSGTDYAGPGLYHPKCLEAGDLDQDGDYEIIVAGQSKSYGGYTTGCVALYKNGTVMWRSAEAGNDEHYGMILNISGTVYVFVCHSGASDGSYSGHIAKLNGLTGALIARISIDYPCHGGLSAGDLDGDRDIELVCSDRLNSPSGFGEGLHAYELDLSEMWVYPIACSPMCSVLVNVTSGIGLEAIILSDATDNAKVYTLSGTSGTVIPAYTYTGTTSSLSTHEQLAVYDWDNDNHFEVLTAASSMPDSWDLTNKERDVTFESSSYNVYKGGYLANVYENGNDAEGQPLLEYIANYCYATQFWDYTGDLVYVDSQDCLCSNVADIDGDSLNEFVLAYKTSSVMYLKCYETLAAEPSPAPRTHLQDFNEQRTRAAVYQDLFGGAAPAAEYKVTVRADGLDYFTWLGANVTASVVDPLISNFNEAAEYIAIWNLTAWSDDTGLWQRYYGDVSGDDWTVHTFDVVQVYLTDTGFVEITMTENSNMDYSVSRIISLQNLSKNKGNNFTGYYASDVSTLQGVAAKTTLVDGETIGWWDDSSYVWRTWVVGFSTDDEDYATAQYGVFWTKVGATRSITVG